MSLKHQQAVQEMLDAIDTFMSGNNLPEDMDELQNAVFKAGSFAVAAYEMHEPKCGGEALAMTRAFLLALVDPLAKDLDYLRSDPASGKAAREARQKGGEA